MKTLQFKFRTKLVIQVVAIALGFGLLIFANILIANRVARELRKINEHYIPLLEVGPRLEAQLGEIMRGLQDAVAANEKDRLEAMDVLNRRFLEDLSEAAEIIYPENPEQISTLQNSVAGNYRVARAVSLRLMENETGMPIVSAMNEMQKIYAQTKEMLQKALIFDAEKLDAAFAAATRAQKTAEGLQLLISGLCLFFTMLLSVWISRSVLRSMASLTTGLVRFGQGDFESPIPVTSEDELGDVAKNANAMAKQIQTLVIELKATNKELESFSYSVAHDLRAPLRASIGFSNALLEDYHATLTEDAQKMLHEVILASKKMGELIDGLLALSRIARNSMVMESVSLSTIAQEVLTALQKTEPDRQVNIKVQEGLTTYGDPRLLKIVLVNLIGNAWKFTRKNSQASIEFAHQTEEGRDVFFVKDNGAGFDMDYSEKLFSAFQRLHSESEFEGTGIGLATVQRIIHRHHGRIWAYSEPEKGATFFFYLDGK